MFGAARRRRRRRRRRQVLPSTEADPEARLAPEQDRLINPYHALPSIHFPYPGQRVRTHAQAKP